MSQIQIVEERQLEEDAVEADTPIHKTLLSAFLAMDDGSIHLLADLVKRTEIREGHDALLDAWETRRKHLGWNRDFGVPAALERKKQASEILTEEALFQELEVGDEFYNAGGVKNGVRYRKSGPHQCVALTTWRRGKISDGVNGAWMVHKVIKG